MTITTAPTLVSYNGNGVTVDFAVPYRAIDATNLSVYRINADNSITPYILSSDYTVAGASDPTGTVTTILPPASGTRLVIDLNVPFTQTKDYVEGDSFPAQSHEDALDKLTLAAAQSRFISNRAMVTPVFGVDGSTYFDARGNRIQDGSPAIYGTDFPIYSQLSEATALAGNLYVAPYAGAVARTVAARIADTISVADFGAKGDGVTDDTAAIQAAVNAGSLQSKAVLFPTKGPYLISSEITLKPSPIDLAPFLSGSDLHFSDVFAVQMIGRHTVIKATAAMTQMFNLVFDTADSDLAPFYAVIEGFNFDGNSLATRAIYSNYSMHLTVRKNSFFHVAYAIQFLGYGVADITANVFKATTAAIALGDTSGLNIGGGDTLIEANDFYITSIGVDVGMSGNVTVRDNTFTRVAVGGTAYGVRLSGDYDPTAAVGAIRHVRVISNEFCGMDAAVYGRKSAGGRNNYNHTIAFNHTTTFSTANFGCIADLNGIDNVNIVSNFCNLVNLSDASANAILLNNCQRINITGNHFVAYNLEAISLRDCLYVVFAENHLRDVGKAGASFVMINLIANVQYGQFFSNTFLQNSASYAQNGIYEQDGFANANRAYNNLFVGVTTRQRANATGGSDFRDSTAAAAKPTTGAFRIGDFVSNLAPAISNGSTILGWLRLTTGTAHTLGTDWAAIYSPATLLQGTAVYDPPSLADGNNASTTVTVTGAVLGMFAQASFTQDLNGVTLTAYVSAANTVTVLFQNESGGIRDLASGTLTARVVL